MQVGPGSDIGQAPRLFDGGPTTGQVVWRALAAAGEHAAQASWIVDTAPQIRAKPHLSLARTCLLGAARALYVLEPDDLLDREVRTLELIREEAKNVIDVTTGLSADGTGPYSGIDQEALDLAHDFERECEAALIVRGKKPGRVIKETMLLENVAHLTPPSKNDPRMTLLFLWRLSSGAAHARSWSWDLDLEDLPTETRFLITWSTPMALMDAAWELWCQRRGSTADAA